MSRLTREVHISTQGLLDNGSATLCIMVPTGDVENPDGHRIQFDKYKDFKIDVASSISAAKKIGDAKTEIQLQFLSEFAKLVSATAGVAKLIFMHGKPEEIVNAEGAAVISVAMSDGRLA